MRRILFTRADGSLGVVTPCVGVDESLTEDEALSRAMKDLPVGVVAEVVDSAIFPTSREKRAAWRKAGAVVAAEDAVWAQVRDARAGAVVDGIDRLQFEHLFDLENRTRILELKTPITRAQYRQALIDKWKTLNP